MKKQHIFYLIMFLMTIISVIAYPSLPERIPFHWNAAGEIDSWKHPIFIFFPILLTMIFNAIFALLKRIDPKRDNFQRFSNIYERFQIVMFLFLFSMWGITLLASFQPTLINIKTLLVPFISMLFMYFGNMMPKIKSNYIFGIRTPWTLANSTVWYRTHRFAGKLWFIAGFLFLTNLLLPPSLNIPFMVIWVFVIALVPCIYSYYIFKQQRLQHTKLIHSLRNGKG